LTHRNHDEVLWTLRRLRHARIDGRLVFVLGSGINTAYGLPDWSRLLVGLLALSGRLRAAPGDDPNFRQILSDLIPDPLLQGAVTRKAFSDADAWLDALNDALIPLHPATDSDKPLAHIARIVANQYLSNRRRHVAVLTFNYDRLLEEALRDALGTRASALHSVSREDTFARAVHAAGVYVYHLHGSIDDRESDIILDASSYVSVLGAPGRHWSWDCMNLYLFRQEAAAMFLGLSLVDPSLRLLLTQSAAKGMTLSGLYVSRPFPELPPADMDRTHALALVARDVFNLFDDVLLDLSLVPYHVTAWSEIVRLLEIVANDD
jgi:hypothetical protein